MFGDTSPEIARMQAEAIQRMSGAERLALAWELTEFAHRLTLSGIRARMPEATPEEIEAEYFAVVLGRPLAEKVLAYRRELSSRGAPSEPR